ALRRLATLADRQSVAHEAIERLSGGLLMHRGLLVLLTLLEIAPALRAQSLEPIPTDKPPIHTRQALFSIPFQIEKPNTAQPQPIEVQLSVSTDRGASWQVSSKVKPEQGNFVFRAPHDGEYWFRIRTID